MGILQLKPADKTSPDVEFGDGEFARTQIESLHKYEKYLMAIATDEMQAQMMRKFGPSDIVQQTFQKAVDNASAFRGSSEEQFRGWLRMILINQLRQNMRDHSCKKRDFRREQTFAGAIDSQAAGIMEPSDEFPTPSTKAALSEEDVLLHQAIAELPENYQTVIRLRNWEKLSFADIGDHMKLSTDAVKKLWYRALVRLQKQIEE